MAETQQVVREFLNLSAEEKKEAKEALERAGGLPGPVSLPAAGIPDPTQTWANLMWLMIVTAFVVLLVGGSFLLYDMSKNGQDTSVILPIITTVLGALVGLMAPSPVQGKK